MNFGELQTEFYARGFNYLNTDSAGQTRAKRWLNESYQELCDEADWPFLETTASGTAPLTISDLRTVASVVNTTKEMELQQVERRWLVDVYSVLTTTGTSRFFYVESGNVVKVYPANTSDTISVYYYEFPADLSGSSDTPVVPARYHNLIIDGACRRAYEDNDEYEAAAAVEAMRKVGIEGMRRVLVPQVKPNPERLILSESDVIQGQAPNQ